MIKVTKVIESFDKSNKGSKKGGRGGHKDDIRLMNQHLRQKHPNFSPPAQSLGSLNFLTLHLSINSTYDLSPDQELDAGEFYVANNRRFIFQ